MAQEKRDNRILLNRDSAVSKFTEGAKALYDAVATTYGPKGMNVILEKPFGRPLVTRDGITVARDVYFSDRAKNMGVQLIREASETTNRYAGDGSTASILLAYQLLDAGLKRVAAGDHPMAVANIIKQDSYKLLANLTSFTTAAQDDQLEQVATVSCGDAAIGQMIAEALHKVGTDGGILTEKAYVSEVECDYIDGYYLQTGFEALQSGKKELSDPHVVVVSRRIASGSDMADILNATAEAVKHQPGKPFKIALIGNVEDAAYNTVVNLVNQNLLDAVIIKTPAQFGAMGKQLLEDIAIYSGSQAITEQVNLKNITTDHVGTLQRVIATKTEATLFGDNTTEDVHVRIEAIKEQIETETVDQITEKLKERVAKLEGKIALFRIGGATDTAKEEKEFRIEDSINATRAAAIHGIVPGGASSWVRLAATEGISDTSKHALQEVFKQLMHNASLPADVKLHELQNAPTGWGFNLRGDEPGQLVDLVKTGILDPSLVVEQIITNASEVAATALTLGLGIIFEDREVAA